MTRNCVLSQHTLWKKWIEFDWILRIKYNIHTWTNKQVIVQTSIAYVTLIYIQNVLKASTYTLLCICTTFRNSKDFSSIFLG